ncbi:MAG: tetratricopeptide repeat protein [candidate division Zixibacteria bacterium]|nr:tetratricopeptide repeat protein [candidate division Zixibacteria bacterium]
MKDRFYRKISSLAVAFLFTAASTANADSFNKEISKGNQSYRQGNYDEAARRYRSAEIDRPGSPVAAYNLGTALVTGKNYEEAFSKLGEAASKLTGPEKALAHYNIGNGLFGAGKFAEAAGAFKKALEINPNDRDAKYNLELALKMLEEQKKNQQNQKQNQKQKEKNEKKDKGGSSDSDSTKQKQNQSQQQNKDQQKSPDQKEQQKMARPKQQMTKEEAERILAALKNEEMKVKKQKKADAIPLVGGRDW